MIPRYTRPEIGAIWTDENKFSIFLEIELLAAEARAERGEIPIAEVRELRRLASFSVKRIDEIERKVKHDVIAFVSTVAESVGNPLSKHIHFGLTSSDVLDTGLAVQLKQSGEIILAAINQLREAVGVRARENKHTPMIGRTHGVHAEVITFGLKLAGWYDELGRAYHRMESAVRAVSVGKLSGAVGTYSHLHPDVERFVCARLGLTPSPHSTQVIPRDRHAEFMAALAILGASLEKFATEVRHLQRTEVLEAEEPFSEGQKGSSAMPHKRNPVTCERIAGLARLLRTNALASLENVALWHERDISHSSVERVILPDSCILADNLLSSFETVIRGLFVYPLNMQSNINLTRGLIHSGAVLLALTERGLSRDEAYAIVQEHSMKVWNGDFHLRDLVSADPRVMALMPASEIDQIFNSNEQLQHLDYIFHAVGLE